MQYGGALPFSAEVLLAAETWGCPPWEIQGKRRVRESSKLRWFLYWRVFQTKRNSKRR